MRWCVSMALVLALVGVASAEEVLLNAGGVVDGEIQKVDENGIVVKSGDKTLTIAPADLDAHYFYEQWAKRVEKTAEAHLRLAVFAYENGLFNQARSQYRKAERLDKEVVKKFEEEVIPRIKEGVAQNLLTLARQAIQKKDWDQAKRLASKILTEMEDTKAADEAREAIASVHLWQLDKDQGRFLETIAQYLPRDAEKALQEQARITGKLDPIDSRMQKAQDLVTKGLRTKSANRQKGIFQQAAKNLEGVIQDLDKLSATAAGDDALQAYIKEKRDVAVREAIDAYVDAGSVYLVRRSYQDAMNMANLALALDPDSDHAKRFQQRTIAGSQMRGGWGGRGR